MAASPWSINSSMTCFSVDSGLLKKGIQAEVSTMTMPPADKLFLLPYLDILLLLPIQADPDLPAQCLQLVELSTADHIRNGLVNGVGLGSGPRGLHQLLDEVIVQVQRGAHW